MKWLVDENLPGAMVTALRAAGFQVAWIRREAPGLPDSAVFERARTEGYVVLTGDKGFGALARSRGLSPSFGIVLLRARASRTPADIDSLVQLLS